MRSPQPSKPTTDSGRLINYPSIGIALSRLSIIDTIKDRARRRPAKVMLPEPEDERILRAAVASLKQGVARPIVLGSREAIERSASAIGSSLDGIEVLEPLGSGYLDEFVKEYCRSRQDKGVSESVARRILTKPLYFACMMVRMGLSDALVAGASTTTSNVIKASHLVIGYEDGISTPSSFFLMETNNGNIGEDGVLVYADAAVNPDPNPEQLADIAIATARSASRLLGWEPRVAMLSFSTKGSATHPFVEKVVKATEIARRKAPEMKIDGELQADAALVVEIAKKKIRELGPVAGRANILIFPDLDAGNIAYKLTQHVGGARAYGPILQGFRKPVSDLSRGAKVEDIVGVIAVVSVLAQLVNRRE